MAAEEAIAAGVFELRADADQFVSAVANAQATAERFERSTAAAFDRAGKASSALGATDIRSWTRETERLIQANERQAASAVLSSSALQQLKAEGKGISAEVYSPLVAALKESEANLLKFNRAVEQARNVDAFSRIVAESEKLGQVGKNIDSITAALGRLEGQEREAGQTRVFDARVAEAAKLGMAEQYMRRYQDAAGDMAAAERAFAADASFVQGLKRRSDAIGKTQADLLELEAAERGISAQAAPYIANLRAQERALGIYSTGARDASVSTNRLRMAMAQLPMQFTDVFTSLAGGQNPLLVLIQQGGQIKDSFGGVGNALRGVGNAIVAAFTPARIVIGGALAALGAFTAGVMAGEKEMGGYRQALLLTGNAAGTTAGQLQATAEAISRTVGTQGKAAETLAALAATGRVAGRDLGLLAEAAIRLERQGGPAVKETVAAFAELGKNPTQGALKLNETTRFLTVSVLEQIRALEEQGKVTEAARVAQEAYATTAISRSKELEAQMGTLERVMRGVADAAKSMWDAVLDIGREGSAADKLASIQSRMGVASRLAEGGGLLGVIGERYRAGLQEEAKAVNRGMLSAAEVQSTSKALGVLTEEYERARKANQKWTDAALTNQERLNKELKEYRANQAIKNESLVASGLPPISAAQQAKEEAAIRKQALGLKDVADKYETVRDAAKEWAAAIKDGQKIQADAEANTLGLTKAQERLVGYLSSAAYKTNTEEMRHLAVQTLVNAHNAELAADAKKKLAKAEAEALEARIKSAVELEKSVEAQDRELQSLRDQYVEITAGKQAREELVNLRLEAAAATWEQNAAQAAADGLDASEYQRMQAMADALRNQIKLRKEVSSATAKKEADEANRKAAEEALREWQRTNDQIGQSLADALMQGGKSAGEYLKGLFRSMVLRPIIQGVVQPVAGAVLGVLGMGNNPSAGGGSAQQMLSGYQALNSGYNALSSGFSSVGNSVAGAYSYGMTASGTTYGTAFGSQQSLMLASQEAGMGTASGAAGSGTVGSVASTAAGAAAGIYGGRAISGGYAAPGSNSGNSYVNAGTAVGTAIGAYFGMPAVGAAVGGWVGGLVNRAFGYKGKEIESRELVGTFTGGNFEGEAVTNFLQKGGWLKSDKRNAVGEAVTGDLDKALDEGGKQINELARKYGEALGLPVAALANVSQDIRVKVTGDLAEDTKAVSEALGQYATALFQEFADDLEPLRASGETISQVIERVGGALIAVNDMLDTLGIAALKTSVDGGNAAYELASAFGGVDALSTSLGSYYRAFYSDAERTNTLQRQLSETFAEYGAVLPKTRSEFRALVDAQDLATEAGRENFVALMQVAGAFDELVTAQDGVSASAQEAARNLQAMAEQIASGLDAVIGDFISGPELANFRASRIAATLQGGGINATAEGVLASDRDDIIALWRAVGDEGKEAILKAYGAWKTLKQGIADDLQGQIDAITAKYGDLSVINDPVETLSDAFVRNREELRALQDGLTSLVGNVGKTVQETLADMLASQQALAAYRTSLDEAIADANLRALTPSGRVDALRREEQSLFAQLGTSADPVATAQRLQGVIVARIKEEISLREQSAQAETALVREAREKQIDALRSQISAAERLAELAKDITQFTSTARFGDLSPLSYADQLAQARGLFDSTLAAAPTDEDAQRNLLTNAQAYLQELAAYSPVGTEAYAREFARVTGALDELGLSAGAENPQLVAAQQQLAVLEAINDSQDNQEALAREMAAAEAAAFTQVQAVLGGVKETQDKAIAAQIKAAEAQIAKQDEIVRNQGAQIQQWAAIANEWQQTMNRLWSKNTEDNLAGAAPTGVGGSSWAGG